MPDWSPHMTSTRLRSGFETCELTDGFMGGQDAFSESFGALVRIFVR